MEKSSGKFEACCIICEHRRAPIRDGASRVTCADQIEMLAAGRSMIRGVSFRMIPGPVVSSKVALIRAARLGIIGYYLPSRIALDDLIP